MMELESNVSTVERLTEYRTEVESKLLLLMMGGPAAQQQVITSVECGGYLLSARLFTEN